MSRLLQFPRARISSSLKLFSQLSDATAARTLPGAAVILASSRIVLTQRAMTVLEAALTAPDVVMKSSVKFCFVSLRSLEISTSFLIQYVGSIFC